MEETPYASRSIEELRVENDEFDYELVIQEETTAYMEGVYDDITGGNYKIREVNFESLRQLQQADICVDLQGEIKLSSDSKIGTNLFIGSNPGLFYSENSDFQQETHIHHFNSESASISKLTSLDPTQKNTARDNLVGKDHSLEISGDTIFDITDCQDANENRIPQQTDKPKQPATTPVRIMEETSRKPDRASFFPIQQNKQSRHSKYCDTVLSPIKKKRDFVVPIIHHDRFTKKSREEYFLINDKNLTNFFVPKNKSNFVHKLGNEEHSRIKDINCDFQKSSVKEQNNSDKGFQKSNIKRFVNTNRESFSSNYNSKLISFNSRDEDDFVSPNVTNTKFIIKMLPSDKTKKHFNQSVSTFINHNYHPVTCRKQFRKLQQSQTYNQQLTHESVDYSNNQASQKVMRKDLGSDDEKQNNMIRKNVSCDKIAMMNSFKNVISNTKKGKILKSSKSQRNFKSSFFRQKDLKPLINFQKLTQKQEISQKQKEKENPVSQSSSKYKQSVSQVTISTNSQQKKFKNLTELQLEMMKNNNIKRVKKFKQVANSKLNIVAKMGVKILPD